MAAIELVELLPVGRMVLRTIPPAPIAAFGDEQFLECHAAALFRGGSGRIEGLSGAQKLGPGLVILLRSDPDIEIGVDPGAGENAVQRFRSNLPQCLAHS